MAVHVHAIQEAKRTQASHAQRRSAMGRVALSGEAVIGGLYLAAALALSLLVGVKGFSLTTALLFTVSIALAGHIRFDVGAVFTVPTQAIFVPMLFVVPDSVIPLLVPIALALGMAPRILRGQDSISWLVTAVTNSWFAFGPAIVFVLLGGGDPLRHAWILGPAIVAQLACDFAGSAARERLFERRKLRELVVEVKPIYAIDLALSGVGLLVAFAHARGDWVVLLIAPLFALLRIFSKEREKRLEQLIELNDAYQGTALLLGDVVEADDAYTGEHSKSVVRLALDVADELGLDADSRRNVEFGALLHDVGKIAVPKEIINKPGKLDEQDWAVIKTHTIEGQRMLETVGGFMCEIGQIVRASHERWDGSGYPDGLSGEAIPLEARIVSACDAFNAMTTTRSYRTAMPVSDAIAELKRCSGSHFDPDVVGAIVGLTEGEQHSSSTVSILQDDGDCPHTPSGLDEMAQQEAHAATPLSAASSSAALHGPALDDVRSSSPVERLLEDSWKTRSRSVGRREMLAETAVASLFLAFAIPLGIAALATHSLNPSLALGLVLLYAINSRLIRFPLGAGYVVPSYLVLVPMLLLLPAGAVPLLAAAGLVAGSLVKLAVGRERPERAIFAISDAWHALGPALVLVLAGSIHGTGRLALVYCFAFLAGCLVDLICATLREATLGVASRVQFRVIAQVWLIDACIAPLGLLLALGARQNIVELLLILPLDGVLLLLSRDRSARIVQAQRRLDVVGRERARLQAAVGLLGDAFAARLDLESLIAIVLRGSIEALDADAGRLTLSGMEPRAVESSETLEATPALQAAADLAAAGEHSCQLQSGGIWALALPFGFISDAGCTGGALAVARHDRAFREDEETLLRGLVERARRAAAEIIDHQMVRAQAVTDSLTKLGNRRRLLADLDEALSDVTRSTPLVLILFDLDGFKAYNDTFGHLAGDALLTRLGANLANAVSAVGTAYRLGGDEFCVLAEARSADLHTTLSASIGALEERGENFAVAASYGAVLIPHEATTPEYALQLADERMYTHKKRRASWTSDQTRDVLARIIQSKQSFLHDRSSEIAQLCMRVGARLAMSAEELDYLARAAELHDVGTIGIPDAILEKRGALNAAEWKLIREHTVLGERILNAAQAPSLIATLVRSSHERWDGNGYPDGLAAEAIPLGARIIAACNAYEAMTTQRSYRQAMSHSAAVSELRREAGRQFDPEVVNVLLRELQAESGCHPHAPAYSARTAIDEVAAYLLELLTLDRPNRLQR